MRERERAQYEKALRRASWKARLRVDCWHENSERAAGLTAVRRSELRRVEACASSLAFSFPLSFSHDVGMAERSPVLYPPPVLSDPSVCPVSQFPFRLR